MQNDELRFAYDFSDLEGIFALDDQEPDELVDGVDVRRLESGLVVATHERFFRAGFYFLQEETRNLFAEIRQRRGKPAAEGISDAK